MGSTFGKADRSATNDLNAAGDVVATGTGVKTVRDPNRGLTDEQIRNRKLLGVAGKGLAAFSNPNDPNDQQPGLGGGTRFTFADNQPTWQPPMPQQDPYTPFWKQKRNPFFKDGIDAGFTRGK